MPLIDRTPRKPDPYLEWKVRFFVVGAGLALIGMYLDMGWLMAIAAVVLAGGFGLRFLTRKHQEALLEEEDQNA
jgi:hypothetical protein